MSDEGSPGSYVAHMSGLGEVGGHLAHMSNAGICFLLLCFFDTIRTLLFSSFLFNSLSALSLNPGHFMNIDKGDLDIRPSNASILPRIFKAAIMERGSGQLHEELVQDSYFHSQYLLKLLESIISLP